MESALTSISALTEDREGSSIAPKNDSGVGVTIPLLPGIGVATPWEGAAESLTGGMEVAEGGWVIGPALFTIPLLDL